MSDFTNYTEQKILEFVFKKNKVTAGGSDNWVPPANLYVAVHTGDPGENGSASEVTGGSYARKQLDPDAAVDTNTNWNSVVDDGAAKSMTNKAAITFVQATANWGTLTHYTIWDALTSGNCFVKGAISPNVVVNSGNTLSFQGGTPGNLKFNVS